MKLKECCYGLRTLRLCKHHRRQLSPTVHRLLRQPHQCPTLMIRGNRGEMTVLALIQYHEVDVGTRCIPNSFTSSLQAWRRNKTAALLVILPLRVHISRRVNFVFFFFKSRHKARDPNEKKVSPKRGWFPKIFHERPKSPWSINSQLLAGSRPLSWSEGPLGEIQKIE